MNATFGRWKSIPKTLKAGLLVSTAFVCFNKPDYKNSFVINKCYSSYKYNFYGRKVLNSILPSFQNTWFALSKDLYEKETDVYIWGNGEQADMSLNYANFYPKKIKNFSTKDNPQIVIVRFGEFHEAYLDKAGKIHICQKHRLPSMKLQDLDDCVRPDMKGLEVKGQKIIDMRFTQNRLFALTDKKEIYVWKISFELPEGNDEADIFSKDTKDFTVSIAVDPIHISELKDIEEIVSGSDHFLARDSNGDVWAMGDDTFGQCGQYTQNRPEIPPFKERRIGKPVKVNLPCKATKIASGFRHAFAINEAGELYGWGYNNQQQLSHSEEFAHETSPRHVLFEPSKISRELEGLRVINIAAGKDFSIIVTKDRKDVEEIWSTGNNLRGQLGINRISHLQDVTKLDDVSGFVDSMNQTPLKVAHLAWGRRHSILTFDYGAFYIWGDNEKGQLGDRTRRMMESPFPKAKFELKHNVLNIEADYDNWAVIVERLPENIRDKDDEDEKRKKKKSKRQAKQIENMPRAVVKEVKPPSLIERIRNKISEILKKRNEEVEKMKMNKESLKEKKEKSDDQIIFEEVTKENKKNNKKDN